MSVPAMLRRWDDYNSMETISVYRFQTWDRNLRQGVWSPLMGTREAIRRRKGEADLDSALQVSREEVDANGLYPKAVDTTSQSATWVKPAEI
jgi:hypothetical protein